MSSNSSSISNLSSSSGRSWRTVFIDNMKLLFVASICIYSLYSAYVKFSPLFFSNNGQTLQLRFKADYSLCNPLIAQGIDQAQCNTQVDKAFADAKTQCNGYIKNFQSCLGQYRDCTIQESNTKSCLSMVTRNELNRWAKEQNPQTISIGN
jgi:hypothetical protein